MAASVDQNQVEKGSERYVGIEDPISEGDADFFGQRLDVFFGEEVLEGVNP